MIADYTRKITHQDYRNPDKLKKYYHRVIKQIHIRPDRFDKNFTREKESAYIHFDDQFLVSKSGNWVVPVVAGSMSFIFMLIFIFPLDESRDGIDWTFLTIGALSTIFFIIYGFTMPKKESILNRKDGLITFTGFIWQPNITMAFKKVEFAYSTGGEDAVGAFQLQIIRPNRWQTFAIAGYIGLECYSNMSFITWYMDKNRPLPPGEAFDAFRQADYKRRKAAGFPKPLYRSNIATPEATKEQRAERKRIGGW